MVAAVPWGGDLLLGHQGNHVGSHDIFQDHSQDPPRGFFQGRRGPKGLQFRPFGAPGSP